MFSCSSRQTEGSCWPRKSCQIAAPQRSPPCGPWATHHALEAKMAKLRDLHVILRKSRSPTRF